jgi:acyl dehydratase
MLVGQELVGLPDERIRVLEMWGVTRIWIDEESPPRRAVRIAGRQISPYPLQCPAPRPIAAQLSATQPEDTLKKMTCVALWASWVGAEEVARAALFLASDDLSFITRIELFVDGGEPKSDTGGRNRYRGYSFGAPRHWPLTVQPDRKGSYPIMYFDDYVPGTVSTLRTNTISEASIIEFARRFDPQEIHVDAAAAAHGPYGGVIASGWHTCALAGHAIVTGYLSPESSLPSPGADQVRFYAPVRAGDTLTWRATVLDTRLPRSNPSRGIVRTLVEAVNQNGSLALSMTAINLIRRGPTPWHLI